MTKMVSTMPEGRPHERTFRRHDDIAHRVDSVLKERGIDISYDPSSQTCRTWYGRTLDITFRSTGKPSNANSLTGCLEVDTNKPNSKKPASYEKITHSLLHEKIHVDMVPIDVSLLSIASYSLWNYIDNPITATLATAATFFAYHYLIDELIVEGIAHLKYGLSIFNIFNIEKKKADVAKTPPQPITPKPLIY